MLLSVTTPTTSSIGVYVSLDPEITKPNETDFTYVCYYISLDTCVIDLSDLPENEEAHATVYFSVFMSMESNITISIVLQEAMKLQIGEKYELDFTAQQEAAIAILLSLIHI